MSDVGIRSTRSTRNVARTLLALSALIAPAALVGCPGSLQDPERFSADAMGCSDVGQTVVAQICAQSLCHSSTAKQGGLDLQSPGLASRLVNVPAMGGPGLLVDPSAPEGSILYLKLTSAPPYGSRMPFNQTPLDPTTMACMLGWIDGLIQGDAGPDGTTGDDGSEPAGDDATSPNDASGTAPSDASGSNDAAHVTPKDSGTADAAKAVHDASTPDATAPLEASAGDDASATD